MLQCRALLSGLTRPSNRSLDNKKEKYTSVTSLKVGGERNGASPKARQRSVRKICNNIAFIGPILRRITGSERITIYSLEDSLLTRIYQYLPLVDQVCLALSCEKLFSQYKVFAKDSSMLPPQPTDHHLPLSHVNSEEKLRIQLLVRLENSRWAYCAKCLLLKPRKMFTPDALKAPNLERRCTRYDGLIELCPCLHLTRRDRKHVMDLLRSPITPLGVRYGCFGFERDGWRLDGHSCPFYSDTDREVRIYTEISISIVGLLILNIWYSLRVSSGDSFVAAGPVFACPHLDLMPLIHTTGDFTRCYKCFASVWKEPELLEDAGLVTFYANRPLGWADKSDDVFWYDRCYNPEDKEGNSEQKQYDPASLDLQLS